MECNPFVVGDGVTYIDHCTGKECNGEVIVVEKEGLVVRDSISVPVRIPLSSVVRTKWRANQTMTGDVPTAVLKENGIHCIDSKCDSPGLKYTKDNQGPLGLQDTLATLYETKKAQQLKTDTDKILEERGSNYGKFKDHASLSMDLKHIMESGRSWKDCSSSQKEALHMVAHKVARIINGKPDYLDSWVDIVGYIQLVINELKGKIV